MRGDLDSVVRGVSGLLRFVRKRGWIVMDGERNWIVVQGKIDGWTDLLRVGLSNRLWQEWNFFSFFLRRYWMLRRL